MEFRKLVFVYSVLSKQFFRNTNYDFGLRSLKEVINTAGKFKELEPTKEEPQLLLRAIYQTHCSRFTDEDAKTLAQLLTHLYPEFLPQEEPRENSEFVNKATDILKKNGLQPVPTFLKKVEQLYQALTTHSGVIISGETGVGRTTLYQILAQVMPHLTDTNYDEIKIYPVYPAVLNTEDMFGTFLPESTDWVDGIVTKHIRRYVKYVVAMVTMTFLQGW